MKDALIVSALSVLPRNPLSRGMGWLSRLRLPRLLLSRLIRWYVRHYHVNLAECEPDPSRYGSLAEFFTRPLRPGARPICADEDALVSPADALVASLGRVEAGRIPQGAALDADIPEMLGGDTSFEGGPYVVLYLSPPDYHRVHAPCDATLARWSYLPGRLFPVFRASTERVRGLFARNERLVCWFESAFGRHAMVMLGAFGVGRIEMVFTDLLSNDGRPRTHEAPSPAPVFARGQEIGRFNLGSTVVLFFRPGTVAFERRVGERVRVGERLGRRLTPSPPAV